MIKPPFKLKPKRKAIPKKLRFDVFKRDGFTCMYCGAHPPRVLLHVDHIRPVADGGENDLDNLVTACEPCNLGKGARLLSSVPMDLSEKAAGIAEREAQIKGFHDVMEAKRLRIHGQSWEIVNMLLPGQDSAPRDWMNSIRGFLDRIGYHAVLEAMEIAIAKGNRKDDQKWRYFCGICWNKVREAEGTANA